MPEPYKSREQRLIEDVLAVSCQVNPTYTHNEHLSWALGILAQVVLRKNHMDNIVFNELHEKLNAITNSKKFPVTLPQAKR